MHWITQKISGNVPRNITNEHFALTMCVQWVCLCVCMCTCLSVSPYAYLLAVRLSLSLSSVALPVCVCVCEPVCLCLYRFMRVSVWSHDCSAVRLLPDKSRPPLPVYVNTSPSSYISSVRLWQTDRQTVTAIGDTQTQRDSCTDTQKCDNMWYLWNSMIGTKIGTMTQNISLNGTDH